MQLRIQELRLSYSKPNCLPTDFGLKIKGKITICINTSIYLQGFMMVGETRDISNAKMLILINFKFREKGNWGRLNYENLLVKLKRLISTVQMTLFLSGICFPIVQSFTFLEKSILVLYHYYRIWKFVWYSLSVLSFLLQNIQ